MIEYTASRLARQEHEERVRSLARVYDYDEWLTDTAGYWQAPPLGSVLAAIATRVASLGNRFKNKQQAVVNSPLAGQEQSPAPSDPTIHQRPKTAIS